MLRSIAIRVAFFLQKYKARKVLRVMTDSRASMKIAGAICATLDNKTTQDEKVWMKRIEDLRKSLKRSCEQLTVTDYGAGASTDSRSEKEMLDGIVISKQVKDFCNGSKPPFWATILFRLIREFGSVSAVELGSCLGISAAYQAAAQKINGAGKITTLEGAESLSALTQKNLQQLGLDNATVVKGRFQDHLESVLQENKPVDYAFIDGHHEEKATIAYFTQILPYLAEESVIVFDDISWSAGMRRAWEKIVKNDHVKIAVDLLSIGICVIDRRIKEKHIYQFPKFSK